MQTQASQVQTQAQLKTQASQVQIQASQAHLEAQNLPVQPILLKQHLQSPSNSYPSTAGAQTTFVDPATVYQIINEPSFPGLVSIPAQAVPLYAHWRKTH